MEHNVTIDHFSSRLGLTPMDCTDLRAILSGFIDSELAPERQHAAERHLVDCAECRATVARAEALDATLRSAAARWGREECIPPSIVECVLARTVADVSSLRRARRSAFAGWLTAAAAVGVATTVWFSQGTSPVGGLVRGSGIGSGGSLAGVPTPTAEPSPAPPARETRASTEGSSPSRPTPRAAESAPALEDRAATPATGMLAADDSERHDEHDEAVDVEERSTSALAAAEEQGSDQPARSVVASSASQSPLLPLHGPPRWLGDVAWLANGGTSGVSQSSGAGASGNASGNSDAAGDWAWSETLERDELVSRIQQGGDAMFLASVLLSQLEFADPTDLVELERIRQIVRYDRLLDRLDEVRTLLAEPQSRGAVEVAESILLQLEQGQLEAGQFAELQLAIQRIELPARLERAVRRLESRSPA